MIDVTLSGVFLCTQAAAQHMEAAGRGGRIINIASQAAKSGFPHMAPYCAAKHGVIGLTRTAAIDYGAAGITVNAICPNHVTTGLGSAQNAYFSAFKGMTEEAYLRGNGSANTASTHRTVPRIPRRCAPSLCQTMPASSLERRLMSVAARRCTRPRFPSATSHYESPPALSIEADNLQSRTTSLAFRPSKKNPARVRLGGVFV